eukprot:TRINITY_DN4975_c1_g2_i1.p1 TRINITY_DN4975_c1_g2~~TRINITY_DN4975_c1_g2_i1.p1  ORF type:complete len:1524 (+),score=324.69 TRINITY_DN4975_c1_g2_i1:674-4573(+)
MAAAVAADARQSAANGNRKMGGAHTQEDLAELFQQALAVGACQDVAGELREYVGRCSTQEESPRELGDYTAFPPQAEDTEATLAPSLGEVTLPMAAVISAAAEAATAVRDRERDRLSDRGGVERSERMPSKPPLLPVASPPPPPPEEATLIPGVHALPSVQKEPLGAHAALAGVPSEAESTQRTDLTALFDIAYANHTSETVTGGDLPAAVAEDDCDGDTFQDGACVASARSGEEWTIDLRQVAAQMQSPPLGSPRRTPPGSVCAAPPVAGIAGLVCGSSSPVSARGGSSTQASSGRHPNKVPCGAQALLDMAASMSSKSLAFDGGSTSPRNGFSTAWGGASGDGARSSPQMSAGSEEDELPADDSAFRIIEFSDTFADREVDHSRQEEDADADGRRSPWWADGDGPTWMRQLDPLAEPPPPLENGRPLSGGSGNGGDGGGNNFQLASSGNTAGGRPFSSGSAASGGGGSGCLGARQPAVGCRSDADHGPRSRPNSGDWSCPGGDATYIPGGQGRRPVGGSRSPPVASSPSLSPSPTPPLERAEQADFVEDWLSNLRGTTNEFVSDDPMVFGDPKPKPKPTKPMRRSKTEDRRGKSRSVEPCSADDASRLEADSEETSAWISNLRGSGTPPEEDGDPLVFAKARPRPLQQRRVPKKPPKRVIEGGGSAGGSGGAGSSGSGARPTSGGYFSVKNSSPTSAASAGNMRQQMPEAMRRRMDQRTEQREQHKQDRGKQPSPPEPQVESGEADGAGVRPGPRGRRASSQPPADHQPPQICGGPGGVGGGPNGSVGGGGGNVAPKRQKKPARPQSTGAGDDDGEKCSRQMFDKNTLRTMHRDLFIQAVDNFRYDNCRVPVDSKRAAIETPPVNDTVPLRVFMRKRPMFEKEVKQRGDFDITTTLPETPVPTRVVLHNCLFQADLKTPFISHITFEFDRVFDADAESADVYTAAAAGLVRNSLDGGVATMFMFGQTGSGKTHTMNAIQELAARDLYKGADGDEPWLSVQFVELRGNRCFDLLAPSISCNGRGLRPELRLREQNDGSYVADGACDLFPKSAEELCSVMQMAQSRRATRATDANDVSSRSHAVCTLRVFQSEGQLMLVDCAGTERRKDSMYHSKERQVEGAEINASLHALKECVRHLTTQQRVPSHAYRASSLTKILADAFIRGADARLAVICTASPCATDTEHTVATMRMGMSLGGRGNEREDKQPLMDLLQARKKVREVHPKKWTPEQVCEWLRGISTAQYRDVAEGIPSNFTGQMLVRLTEGRCVQICNGSEKMGRYLFDMLHQEIQRVEQSRKQ